MILFEVLGGRLTSGLRYNIWIFPFLGQALDIPFPPTEYILQPESSNRLDFWKSNITSIII